MDYLIRKMESKDLDVVKSIDKLAFPNPWPENAYNYELDQNPNARLWVVEDQQGIEKTVIGFAVVWVVIDEAHIGTIAIHPDFQNRGRTFAPQRRTVPGLQPKRSSAVRGLSMHTVETGETMYSISQKYAIKLSSLYKMNLMDEGTECRPGQKLRIR